VAFILESRDPGEDFPFGSDQVFEALPEREGPTGAPQPNQPFPAAKEFVFTGKWGNPAPFLAKR
jgi:hypothetical protein